MTVLTKLIEDKNFLSDLQKDLIKNEVLGSSFPFYWEDSAAYENDGHGYLVHTILARPEGRKQDDNRINSDYYEFFLSLFDTFCNKHNIKYREVLRMAINLTMNNGTPVSPTHIDHDFPHNQFLLYFNDSATSSTTIYDKDKTILHEIKAEQFKGVAFPDNQHSVTMPTEGRRVVGVYTFR